MKLNNIFSILLFATVAVVATSQKSNSQSSQFGGPNQNGVFPETGLMGS
jgi:hypothetical protein